MFDVYKLTCKVIVFDVYQLPYMYTCKVNFLTYINKVKI